MAKSTRTEEREGQMKDENLQFPIPNSVLEPYIKTAVSTAIVASIGDGTKLIEKAVAAALSVKVNKDGIVDKSSYYNEYPLIETIAGNKIREVANSVINNMAESMRPQIESEIKKYIGKQSSILAKTLVDGLIKGISCKWNVDIKIEK